MSSWIYVSYNACISLITLYLIDWSCTVKAPGLPTLERGVDDGGGGFGARGDVIPRGDGEVSRLGEGKDLSISEVPGVPGLNGLSSPCKKNTNTFVKQVIL